MGRSLEKKVWGDFAAFLLVFIFSCLVVAANHAVTFFYLTELEPRCIASFVYILIICFFYVQFGRNVKSKWAFVGCLSGALLAEIAILIIMLTTVKGFWHAPLSDGCSEFAVSVFRFLSVG